MNNDKKSQKIFRYLEQELWTIVFSFWVEEFVLLMLITGSFTWLNDNLWPFTFKLIVERFDLQLAKAPQSVSTSIWFSHQL